MEIYFAILFVIITQKNFDAKEAFCDVVYFRLAGVKVF